MRVLNNTSLRSAVMNCGNGFGGYCWIIILLVILFAYGGCGANAFNNGGCGCNNNCGC